MGRLPPHRHAVQDSPATSGTPAARPTPREVRRRYVPPLSGAQRGCFGRTHGSMRTCLRAGTASVPGRGRKPQAIALATPRSARSVRVPPHQLTPPRSLQGQFFFPPRQSAFDASPVDAQPPLLPQLLRKSGSTEIGIIRLLFLKELHDLLTQLVCPSGTTLLRQQPYKTVLLKRGLRFIERRPRETELCCSLGDAASLY